MNAPAGATCKSAVSPSWTCFSEKAILSLEMVLSQLSEHGSFWVTMLGNGRDG